MADIVFSTLVDVDSDEVTILPDLATDWTASPGRDRLHLQPEPGRRLERRRARHRRRRRLHDRLGRPEPGPRSSRSRLEMWFNVKGGDAVDGDDEHPRGHQEDRRPTRSRSRSKAPDSTFLRRIAGAVYYIQPKHILDGPDRRSRRRPASSAWAPPARRSAPARTTSPSRSRPPARPSRRKKNYWKGKDSQIDKLVYKIQESNVSVAQLAAGELDLVIRVPPAEGPGLANVAGPQAAERAGRRHLQHQLQQQQHRQGAPPGDRLRDQPAGDHRAGPRRPRDAQLHDPARVHGLRRHQQVRVRPGQGQGAARHVRAGTSARPSGWPCWPRTRTSPSPHRRSSSTSRPSA